MLPNNKNIIMAAEQAVHLSEEKKVIVVPTKTIPQGISAMLAVDPEAEQDSELALAMLDATKHVRSGQVTYAARDSEFDGKKIKQGEYLSLCEGKLCANGKETSVIKKLAREMVSDDSAFATVIFGEGVTEEQAAEVRTPVTEEIRRWRSTSSTAVSGLLLHHFGGVNHLSKHKKASETAFPMLFS